MGRKGRISGKIEEATLSNGITVVAETIPQLRSVSIGVWVRAGSATETEQINGASHLLEHLFFKGTKRRSYRDINEAIELVGGVANAYTAREYTFMYMKVIDEHLGIAIDLLSDILLNSVFDEGEFRKEKRVIIEEIKTAEDTPEDRVHEAAVRLLWPDHPLGLPIGGDKRVVRSLSREQVVEYFRRWYNARATLIALAGNVRLEQVLPELERAFGRMRRGRAFRELNSLPGVGHRVLTRHKKLLQVHLCMMYPAVSIRSEERFAFYLLNNILGASSASRLFHTIREKYGLAYDAYTYTELLTQTGFIGIYVAVAPHNLGRCLRLVVSEIERMRVEPVSERELETAKEQFKSSTFLSVENTFNRMVRIAKGKLLRGQIEPLERVIQRVERVTADEIQALAYRLFDPAKLNMVVLGPIKRADRVLINNWHNG